VGLKLASLSCLTAAGLTAQALPDNPGKELFEVICSSCHAPTKVIGKQWTKAQWESKVLEMLQEEPDVTQPERDKIVAYLAASFPAKININKAPAKEIEAALELSVKEAEAIITHRSSNGAFKSIDDVKKVPGLDPAKIESKKDRLEF